MTSQGNRLAGSDESSHATADPQWIKAYLDSDDLKVVSLQLPGQQAPLTVVYLETLIDQERLVSEICEPLQRAQPGSSGQTEIDSHLPPGKRTTDGHMVVSQILLGHVAIFPPEGREAILLPIPDDKHRSVTEGKTELQMLGPKAAFTEHLGTSLNQLRRLLPTPQLRIREQTVGRLSKTRVAIAYLDGITNPDIGQSLYDAVSRVDTDFIRDPTDLETILIGRTLTPFPLARRTEQPDRVASALADGRAAVLVDGSPFSLIVPTTFNDLITSQEPFLGGSLARTFVRNIRITGLILALLAPALHAALLIVNPDLVPPEALLAASASREGIPYSILIEALVMNLILDLVTEATISAPGTIGQSMTIAGSLIIGQAAVQARLASQLMVVVLAFTSLGSMLAQYIPLANAVRIFRYVLVLLGGFLGVPGLILGVLFLLTHLASLKSWGVPYLSPIGPTRFRDLRLYGAISAAKNRQTHRPQTYEPVDQERAPAGGKKTR